MAVVLRDKHNKQFHFTLDPPPFRDSALPAFTASQDALTFLDTLNGALGNALTMNDWFNIHDQLTLISPKEKTAIKKQLAAQLVNNTLHLIPAKSEMPKFITIPPRSTGVTSQNTVAQDQDFVVEARSPPSISHPHPQKKAPTIKQRPETYSPAR